VFMTLEGDDHSALDSTAADLEREGHPVIRRHLGSRYQVASEMYSWEVAVSLASSILGVHPFDQPDVQLTKKYTHEAMLGGGGGLKDGDTTDVGESGQLGRSLAAFVEAAGTAGYFSLQAFLPFSRDCAGLLRGIRSRLQEITGLVGTVGFGPRYLHSTGQLHKGGPPGGVFLQLVDEPTLDLPVPESDFSFARLIAAQSQGDFMALRREGRSVIRLSLGRDRARGLDRVCEALDKIHSKSQDPG
jgi:transaldolase/glucose-6-phosphate isomerase